MSKILLPFPVCSLLLTRSGDVLIIGDRKECVERVYGITDIVTQRDQRFAFVCGLHDRLGNTSALRVCNSLDRRLMRFMLEYL